MVIHRLHLQAHWLLFIIRYPVGHVEAGLRSYDKYSPYPEEMNRILTGHIAEIHFVPTGNNKSNLIKGSISKNIYITGNTDHLMP